MSTDTEVQCRAAFQAEDGCGNAGQFFHDKSRAEEHKRFLYGIFRLGYYARKNEEAAERQYREPREREPRGDALDRAADEAGMSRQWNEAGKC